MCKKLGIAAVLVAGSLLVLNGTKAGSYTKTWAHNLFNQCKKQVPLEFEVDCLRQQISQLVPNMRKQLSSIAEEKATIEQLRRRIEVTQAKLQTQKEAILTMTRDLDNGTKVIRYGGEEYSADRIRRKLDQDFESYKVAEAELKSQQELLEAKETALEPALKRLANIKQEKADLEIQLVKLEAKLKKVRLAQTRNKFQFDDSELGRCKQQLADLDHRIEVEKKTAELEGEFANDAIPVEKKDKPTKDLTKEIKGYFNGESTNNRNVASDK
jgi:chromosome segregation ATPase